MAGLIALSCSPHKDSGAFLHDLFWGTFYQQHLSEEYGGLSTLSDGHIRIRTHRGQFRHKFEGDLSGLEGNAGIGYCGPVREPYYIESSKLGPFSICFTGNIINSARLREGFEASGHAFGRNDNIGLITRLICQGDDFVDGIKKMDSAVEGAYTLLILAPKGIYAVTSSTWPLVMGKQSDATIIATESGCFSNLTGLDEDGYMLTRDLEPGEILFLHDGKFETLDKIPDKKCRICSFLWVYTAFPNAVIQGIAASKVRSSLGAMLAKRDIANGLIPDFVAAVPDSGRDHAIGYLNEYIGHLEQKKIEKAPRYVRALLKYPYSGRSYTPSDQRKRDIEAHIKLMPAGSRFEDKTLVVCDDSVVRGTQVRTNLVPKLTMLGFKEIHLRASNPELLSHCRQGKSTKKGEVLATLIPDIKDRVKYLGVASLAYSTIDDLVKAIGLPRESLCVECDLPL